MEYNLDIQDIKRRYLSGKSLNQIAKELGVSRYAIKRRLVIAGMKIRRTKPVIEYNIPIQDIAHRYVSGEPEYKIAKSLGVGRNVIKRRLEMAGIRRRTGGEVGKLVWQRRSPAERQRFMAATHAASRGIKQTEERRCKVAITREWEQVGIERGENILGEKLRNFGLTITFQKAIGRYNVDIAIHEGSIAVEIFGGNFHSSGRHAARFRKRCDYLLNHGWLPVIIWVTRHFPLELEAIEYLISLSERRSSGESFGRQEHVIRGDGYIATGKSNPDNGAFVISRKTGFNSRG